jgi:hypothetical protein
MSVHAAGGSLADKEGAALLRNECHEPSRGGADAAAEAGELMNAAFSIGDAVFGDRTSAALGLPWRADQRAEFHEGLVEVGTGAGGVMRDAWCVMRDA